MPPAKTLKRHQLVDTVIEHLRSAISSGSYPIGSKLPPEPQLTAELGVGRSTLREAVRVLSHSGVLEVRQGDGTYIRAVPIAAEPLAQRIERAQLREIQEVRRALEVETARLAAMRRSPRAIEQIAWALARRQSAVDEQNAEAALDADIAFHTAIAEAGGNAILLDLYRAFSARLRPALAELWTTPGGSPEALALHQRLYQAIADGNPDDAIAATIALLERHDLPNTL